MRVKITGFEKGRYFYPENIKWLKENIGKIVKAEMHNINYVRLENGFLCHRADCWEYNE